MQECVDIKCSAAFSQCHAWKYYLLAILCVYTLAVLYSRWQNNVAVHVTIPLAKLYIL